MTHSGLPLSWPPTYCGGNSYFSFLTPLACSTHQQLEGSALLFTVSTPSQLQREGRMMAGGRREWEERQKA